MLSILSFESEFKVGYEKGKKCILTAINRLKGWNIKLKSTEDHVEKMMNRKNILWQLLILLLITANLFGDFQFAKELYDDGLYDEAIKEFQKVVSDYPTSKEAEESLFYIGKSYREQGRYGLAEKNINQIWQGYPNSCNVG